MQDLLIWQYRGKPKAKATINLLMSEVTQVTSSIVQFANILSIDDTKGWGLDLVGYHVGMPRAMANYVPKSFFGWGSGEGVYGWGVGKWYPANSATHETTLLDDDDYRFMIKAKVLKNYQTATLPNIIESARFLFGKSANVIDHENMTMTVYIPNSLLNNFKIYAIKSLDILVKPVGVKYNFVAIDDKKPFGWGDEPSIYGWGEGIWARPL